jgi:hypothetical protein
MTCVDPHSEVLLSLLGEDAKHITVVTKEVQRVPLSLFEELELNDIVFIDSSHVLKTGSDVCFELFEILPRLKAGVLVHFHDVFWPFEYPSEWVMAENRSWNELYVLRAFLMCNNKWDIIMFNDFLQRFERPLIERTFPQFLRNPGGALWIQKRL